MKICLEPANGRAIKDIQFLFLVQMYYYIYWVQMHISDEQTFYAWKMGFISWKFLRFDAIRSVTSYVFDSFKFDIS